MIMIDQIKARLNLRFNHLMLFQIVELMNIAEKYFQYLNTYI